jgi:hypothetical protein
LRAALKASPEFAPALIDAAWLMATCPDEAFRNGAKAEELANKAVQLTGEKNARALAALAAALAERGKFEEAQKAQESALQAGFGDKRLTEGAEADLELFKQEKPVRLKPAAE